MFHSFGLCVEYLRREKIGGLELDASLSLGAVRRISAPELEKINTIWNEK
jgi:16S rRNA U516 pseudouridylate synthase RsuA-like enzyme